MAFETERVVLAQGPVYGFDVWPHPALPKGTGAGVYTIWRDAEYVYAGLSGGLYQRLNSHRLGRRGGDQFCLYVCDRFVLPTLTPDEIAQVEDGTMLLDHRTRDYIARHLTFRFIGLPDVVTARALERSVRAGLAAVGLPVLNPLVP